MSWVGGKAVVYTGLVILKQFIRVLCLDMMTQPPFSFYPQNLLYANSAEGHLLGWINSRSTLEFTITISHTAVHTVKR